MSDDVNIERLIRQTHGMTGAHIEQLVRRAVHSAMKQDLQSRRTLRISDEDTEKLQVENIDFTVASQKFQTQVEKHTAFERSFYFIMKTTETLNLSFAIHVRHAPPKHTHKRRYICLHILVLTRYFPCAREHRAK